MKYLKSKGKGDTITSWLRIAPDLSRCWESAYSNSEESVLPAPFDTMKAFKYFLPRETKVVILGQDPYHTPGKANGLAFGYHKDYHGGLDSSLENICKELGVISVGKEDGITSMYLDFDLSLEKWAQQGVLLLNTCLTVRAGTPLSHKHIGWQYNVLKVLQHLAEEYPEIIYLAWGAEAKKLLEKAGTDPHMIVSTSHPCRFSHNSGKEPFTGSQCFDKVDMLLAEQGRSPIIWR